MLQTKVFTRMGSKTAFVRIYADKKPSVFPKTTDDVEDEPDGFNFAIGSVLIAVEDSEKYMVKSDGTWTYQGKIDGGGGGGDVDPDDIATDSEVEDYVDSLDIFGD